MSTQIINSSGNELECADPDVTPILPGLFPDPSICRVGSDFYVANSSMELAPAIPIWHSTDLTTWTLIANALTTEDQFKSGIAPASRGQYAPTLRHRDGLFYLIGTEVGTADEGHWLATATDPAGPWTSPMRIQGIDGIDPDIAWDESGTCLLTYCSWDNTTAGIKQVAFDVSTGALLDEPRWIWHGSGLSHPEGPHLYKRGKWWYLVIAEGGTERGHVISVARAETARGPFEGHPHNPIFTHRSLRHPVQNVGHADLLELADGSWAAVYLGVRPRGGTPRFHVNGRETFIAGIEWDDGWPRFTSPTTPVLALPAGVRETWTEPSLNPRWVSPGIAPQHVAVPSETGVRLISSPAPSGAPSGLFTRPSSESWEAQFEISNDRVAVRMLLRIDDRHWYAVTATRDNACAAAQVGDLTSTFGTQAIDPALPVTLWMRTDPATTSGPDLVTLGVAQGGSSAVLAELDGRYLSTEVAGGFTGRIIGVVADEASTHVNHFTLTPIPAALPASSQSEEAT